MNTTNKSVTEIGTNLCDENYKHIKKVEDIVKVINKGVAGGAMPAWATRIPNKNDIVMVSAYVASLRGTSPADPKGPDGSLIAPWSVGDPPVAVETPATGATPATSDAPGNREASSSPSLRQPSVCR